MAFINQVFAKDENLLKVGKVSNATPRVLSTTSTNLVEFTPGFANTLGSFTSDSVESKVLLFDNGQVKTVRNAISNTVFRVDPQTVSIPPGTSFTVYEPSMYMDDESRLHFGKSYSGTMMQNETGIDLNFGRIRNVSLPTHAHDVATKQYVDSQKLGIWNQIFTFDGDGVTTVFTITEPISMYNALVSVGGVIQQPYDSYEVEQYDGFTRINFKNDPPPLETKIIVRASTATNVIMSPAIEEIFISADGQDTFLLDNEVMDKFGLLISIDGVVQSTLNYDILTTSIAFETDPNTGVTTLKGNEYKILKFAEPLNLDAVVRVLNLRGKNFHSHTGTYYLLNDTTLVPNSSYQASGTYSYDTVANSNNTINVTHDMIAHRGGLHLYANTTCSDLYINLPEMGSEYSPDNHLEVKVVKNQATANVYINAHVANFMNYEGVLDGHSGGGVVFAQQNNIPTVIHLEYESFYRTWYIKYGMGLWYVNANTVSYPDVSPY